MLDFNEGKACDAIVRRLEEREGRRRSDVRWPDQEGHKSPVEIAFKLGSQLFALEHTGVEPFPGHMEMENRSKHLYAPITLHLAYTLASLGRLAHELMAQMWIVRHGCKLLPREGRNLPTSGK